MDTIPQVPTSSYGLHRDLPNLAYAAAIEQVKITLAAEGFGVLSEIDIKATLKKKLGADVRDYTILGACNPNLAHEALRNEPALGLLLPCNVVVAAGDNGGATIDMIDPVVMFSVVGRPELETLAVDVRTRLERSLAAVPERVPTTPRTQ